MSARALLKSHLTQKAQTRITHPLAVYTASGQLKCRACGMSVRYVEQWEGHLGSKAHRVGVGRMREGEGRERERGGGKEEGGKVGKRKGGEGEEGERKKRRVDGDEEMETGDATNPPPPTPTNGFPSDFFSDPSKAPDITGDSDDEEAQPNANGAPQPPPQTEIDLEWLQFQRSVLNAPDVQNAVGSTNGRGTGNALSSRYEGATVTAEPELLSPSSHSGFPPLNPDGPAPENSSQSGEGKLDEDKKKSLDEREEIMDRLVDEERAQEEADARVGALKARLEVVRREREARRARRREARVKVD